MTLPTVSLMSLFQTGSHFGGGKSKLNPKLKSRVYSTKDGFCIIDLVKTIDSLNSLNEFFYNLGKTRKQVLIVGTFDHIKDYVPELSAKFLPSPMPYVNYRWLGGTLSNWSTIRRTLKTLEKIYSIENNSEFYEKLTRNEKLNLKTQKSRITKFVGGLQNLKNNRPGAVLVLDTYFNPIAIKEAESCGLPVIALSNTNSKFLPKYLKNLIVCNTNSRSTVEQITGYLVDSYNQGVNSTEEKKLTK